MENFAHFTILRNTFAFCLYVVKDMKQHSMLGLVWTLEMGAGSPKLRLQWQKGRTLYK